MRVESGIECLASQFGETKARVGDDIQGDEDPRVGQYHHNNLISNPQLPAHSTLSNPHEPQHEPPSRAKSGVECLDYQSEVTRVRKYGDNQ